MLPHHEGRWCIFPPSLLVVNCFQTSGIEVPHRSPGPSGNPKRAQTAKAWNTFPELCCNSLKLMGKNQRETRCRNVQRSSTSSLPMLLRSRSDLQVSESKEHFRYLAFPAESSQLQALNGVAGASQMGQVFAVYTVNHWCTNREPHQHH